MYITGHYIMRHQNNAALMSGIHSTIARDYQSYGLTRAEASAAADCEIAIKLDVEAHTLKRLLSTRARFGAEDVARALTRARERAAKVKHKARGRKHARH